MYVMLFFAVLAMLIWSAYGYIFIPSKKLAWMYLGGLGVCSAILFTLLFKSAGML